MEQIQIFMTEIMNKLKSMSESEIKEYIDEGFDGTYGKELILINQKLYNLRNRMRWFSKIPPEETYIENFGEISPCDMVIELNSKLVTSKVKFNAFKIIDNDVIATMSLMADEFFPNDTRFDMEVFNQRYSMEDYNAMMDEIKALCPP